MITQLAGNGRLLLTVNENGDWNELFYPFPGQFQQLREARLGLYDVAASRFAWLRGGNGYQVAQVPHGAGHLPESLWNAHGVTISVRDHVHPNHDLIARVFRIRADPPRPVRLFAYHAFQIAESMYQDTAYVDESIPSLVHYKRGFFFEFFSNPAFTHAVCGEHTLKGLAGNVRRRRGRPPGGAARRARRGGQCHAVGHPLDRRRRDGDPTVHGGGAEPPRGPRDPRLRPPRRPHAVRPRVGTVLGDVGGAPATASPGGPQRERHGRLYRASVLVDAPLRRHLPERSSPRPTRARSRWPGDTYNYCWWRDGGYIAKAMDEAGLYENSSQFLSSRSSARTRTARSSTAISPTGRSGAPGIRPPFLQIDQTATVIAAAWHHFKRGGDPDVLARATGRSSRGRPTFLASFRDPATGLPAPSFDLWEERMGIHTYSAAAVAHALERASRIASEIGKDPSVWKRARPTQ